MNKKNVFKIILDFVMAVVLALMFRKMSLGLNFHEIGGLVLLGVFIFHIILNWKWVAVTTRNVFKKETPKKIKICYFVNVLLIVCFFCIGISGVFISKIVFNINALQNVPWQMIHYTSSAVALLLVGIHLGLHVSFITGMLSKMLPGKGKPQKMIGIVLSIILIGFGAYSLKTTSYIQWITMPVTGQSAKGHNFNKNETPPSRNKPSGSAPSVQDSGSSSDSSTTSDENVEFNNENPESSNQGKGKGFGAGGQNRKGLGNKNGEQSISIQSALLTIGNFFSITYLFAAITALIYHLLTRNKKHSS
ncbi:MAG: DUF4405 domain-containing protein [Anaerostipes sp.]|nr:DUF4405 domain-containing protein [Anaerostipes sp.]